MFGLNKPIKPSADFQNQVVSVCVYSLFLVSDLLLEKCPKMAKKKLYTNLRGAGMNHFHPGLQNLLTNLKNKTNVSHSDHRFMFRVAVQCDIP